MVFLVALVVLPKISVMFNNTFLLVNSLISVLTLTDIVTEEVSNKQPPLVKADKVIV